MSKEELSSEEADALKAMQEDSGVEPEGTVEHTDEPKKDKKEAETPEEFQEEVKAEEKERGEDREGDKKPPEGFVPHQAMHSERVKRQQAEKDLEDLKARLAALEKPTEQPPEWKDPLVDPEGHRKWAEYNNQQTTDQVKKLVEQQQEQARVQQRVSRAQHLEQEYIKENPDYLPAAQWLHNERVTALRTAGYSDSEISQQIAADSNAIFDAAEQVGMNPAQFLYLRAQAQGYQKAPETPATPAQQQPTDAEKVVALATAQKATESLGNTPGEAQEGKLTVAALAEMSEAQLAKVPDAEIKRLLGG